MSTLFSNVKIYAGNWSVKSTEKLTEAEKGAIKSAVTTMSDYGVSVCFFLNKGGQFYRPLSRDCDMGVGEIVDLDKIEVITLQKEGEADIIRVNVVK